MPGRAGAGMVDLLCGGIAVGLLAAALTSVSGCGGPSVASRIQARPVTPGTVSEKPSPSPSPSGTGAIRITAVKVTGSLKDLDWRSAEVPATFCGVQGLTRLSDGEGRAGSSTHGAVHLGIWGEPVILPSGSGAQLAALVIGCDNGGGTAAGQIAFAAVLFGVRDHRLTVLHELPPQFDPPGSHIPLIDSVTLAPRTVTIMEKFYREQDPDCCPSGKARTVWHQQGDDWVPDQPQLLS